MTEQALTVQDANACIFAITTVLSELNQVPGSVLLTPQQRACIEQMKTARLKLQALMKEATERTE